MNRFPVQSWMIVLAVLLFLGLGSFWDWWMTYLTSFSASDRIGDNVIVAYFWFWLTAPLLFALGGLALYTWGLPRLPRPLLVALLIIGLLIALSPFFEWQTPLLFPKPVLEWSAKYKHPGYLSLSAALLAIGSMFLLFRRAKPHQSP